MKRILALYYSQSGQVRRALDHLLGPIRDPAGNEVTVVSVQPITPFPYPWRSIVRFFDVMPETVLGFPEENCPLRELDGRSFDLVVLAYPVWFLMPALPIQRLLNGPDAKLLSNAEVVTLCVCRGMWHHASRFVERTLRKLDCRHLALLVATHQGPSCATFLTVPRQLITGSSHPIARGFPPAGIGDEDLTRLGRLGSEIADRLANAWPPSAPLSFHHPTVRRQKDLILPEILAWPYFFASAHAIRFAGVIGRPMRTMAVFLFALVLVILILFGLPLATLVGRASRLWRPEKVSGQKRCQEPFIDS
jgi:hypothetical protein